MSKSYDFERRFNDVFDLANFRPASKDLLELITTIVEDIKSILDQVYEGDLEFDNDLEDQALLFFFEGSEVKFDEAFSRFIEDQEVSVDTILDYISFRIAEIVDSSDNLISLADQLSIKVIDSDRIFVIPSEIPSIPRKARGLGNLKGLGNNKSKLIIQGLLQSGICADEISLVVGKSIKNSSAIEAYNCIQIPNRGINILVNDKHEQAIFVVLNNVDLNDLFGKTKTELKDKYRARKFSFDPAKQSYALDRIFEIILAQPVISNDQPKLNQAFQVQEMDKNYYDKCVASDFARFADLAGCEITEIPVTLNGQVVCNSGKEFNFRYYLTKAGLALGFFTDREQARSGVTQTYHLILEDLGYKVPKLPNDYFSIENLEYDLNQFAKIMGLCCPTELRAHMKIEMRIDDRCDLTWRDYLTKAGRGLGFYTDREEARNKSRLTLNYILNELGYEVEEFDEMDKPYFTTESIKADLQLYADAAGCSINELKAGFRGQVVCLSGQELKFYQYLFRAGKAFDLCKTAREAQNMKTDILNYLRSKIDREF